LSWVNTYAGFLIIYLGVISLAFIAGFVHSPMVVANSWFIRQRARAMTVVSAAVPVGGALISPLLAFAVSSLGWRWAAFISGCAFLLVCVPLSFQVRRSPESMGLLPDGDKPRGEFSNCGSAARDGSRKEADSTAGQAMKTIVFWLLVTSMMLRVAAYSTVTVHFVPIMERLEPRGRRFFARGFCVLQSHGAFLSRLDRRQSEQALASVHLPLRVRCCRIGPCAQRCTMANF